jgi:hypothetical protein
MALFPWRRSPKKRKPPSNAAPRHTFRPMLEVLERRDVFSTALSWAALGPDFITNVGQTIIGSGTTQASGRVTGLAASPNPANANTFYAATAGGGIWKTTDAGGSWAPLTDNLTDAGGSPIPLFMGAVAIAPSNDQVLYAGTGEADNAYDSYYGDGILVSTDGGSTWALTGQSSFQGRAISRIAVGPQDPNTAYAAVNDTASNGLGGNAGIWKTSNGGQTWTNMTGNAGLSTYASWSDVVLDPQTTGSGAIVFAAAGEAGGAPADGVYKSTDGGQTWARSGNFLLQAPDGSGMGRIALTISNPPDQGAATLYASISNPATSTSKPSLAGVEKSTDAGQSWQLLSGVPDYLSSDDAQGSYDNVIAADPTNPNIVYAGGAGGVHTFVASIDGGQTWTDLSQGFTTSGDGEMTYDGTGPHADQHAIAFTAGGLVLAGNDGGVFTVTTTLNPDAGTVTAAHWAPLNNGLETLQFTGIALDTTAYGTVYGGTQDNGTVETTGSLAWNEIGGGDGGFVRVDPTTSGSTKVFYVSGLFGPGFLHRYSSGGQVLTEADSGINTSDPANGYPPFVMDASNPQRLLLGTNQLYETLTGATSDPNYGNNDWHPLQANNFIVPGTPQQPGVVDAVAIAPSDGNTIYMSSDSTTTGNHLFVTTDDGQTWNEITPRDGLGNSLVPGIIKDIAIDPGNSQNVLFAANGNYTGGKGHVWLSTDGGSTWTDISGNLPDVPANALALFPKTQQVFVGTDVGVYSVGAPQVNGRQTQWSRYGNALPNAQVVNLEAATVVTDPNTGATIDVLAAGTHGRSAWEIPLTGVPLVTVSPPSAIEGQDTGTQALATFTDSDPAGGSTPTDFTAIVTWGDGPSDRSDTSSNVSIVDNGDGSFTVLGNHTYGEDGNLPFSVQIIDLEGNSDSQSAPVVITDAGLDQLTVTPPSGAVEGQLFSGTVAAFSDLNPQPDIKDFTALVSWGDGTTTTRTAANGGIVANSDGSFRVLGSHTFVEEAAHGGFSVVVNDLGGASVNGSFPITIADAALTVTKVIPPTSLTEGHLRVPAYIATFRDAAPKVDINDFTAVVNWGDSGSIDVLTAANGGIVKSGDGTFSLVDNHRFAEEGKYYLTVAISDKGGATTATSAVVSVPDAGLKITHVASDGPPEGRLVDPIAIATFKDENSLADINDYTATVTWSNSDGSDVLTAANGGIVPHPGGTFNVVDSHYFAEEGDYSLTVQIADQGGAITSTTATISVPDASLEVLSFTPPDATEGQPPGTVVLATFMDNNSSPAIDDFTAKLTWGGDGSDVLTAANGGIRDNHNGTYCIVDGHTFSEEGSVQVSLQVNDLGGASANSVRTVTVHDAALAAAPRTIATQEGAGVEGVVATFTDADLYATSTDYKAEVDWGDGGLTAFVIVELDPQVDGLFDVVAGKSAPYTQGGQYPVRVTITDNGGSTTTVTSVAAVADFPITATAVVFTPQEGHPFSGPVATFTDGDTTATPSELTAAIEWGDGHTSLGTIVAGDGPGAFVVLGSHTYTQEGPTIVSVFLMDIGGTPASTTEQVTVINPPGSRIRRRAHAIARHIFNETAANITDANSAAAATDLMRFECEDR